MHSFSKNTLYIHYIYAIHTYIHTYMHTYYYTYSKSDTVVYHILYIHGARRNHSAYTDEITRASIKRKIYKQNENKLAIKMRFRSRDLALAESLASLMFPASGLPILYFALVGGAYSERL